MPKENRDPVIAVRFPAEERRRLEKQAKEKKISLSRELRFQLERAIPLPKEIETAIGQLAERAQCTFPETVEILTLAYLTRQAAKNIVWGESQPCIEFQKTAKGEQLTGLRLGTRMMKEYQRQEHQVRESATPAEIKLQSELVDRIAENLGGVHAILKNVLEVLELPVVMELPAAAAISEAVKNQVDRLANMESVLQYVN